jgi:hypothetical protein
MHQCCLRLDYFVCVCMYYLLNDVFSSVYCWGSSRCSSPAGIARVEIGVDNLDRNPRPPRPNPRTARHLH